MGSRQGQRASQSACFVVPPLFRADSGTNLFKQGDISKVGHWLNKSVVSRIARGPGFESRSGHDCFLPCDIWCISVGSRQGQRASKCACLVVPPLFRADSGTNLIKQGEMSKDDHWLNNSVVSRIPRGPGFKSRSGHDFFLPLPFGGSVWVRGKGNEHQNVHVSLFLRCSEQIRGRI